MGNMQEDKLGLGPNTHQVRLGEVLKFQLVQINTVGILFQGIKLGQFKMLAVVEVKNK
jgi:hypothetical protein